MQLPRVRPSTTSSVRPSGRPVVRLVCVVYPRSVRPVVSHRRRPLSVRPSVPSCPIAVVRRPSVRPSRRPSRRRRPSSVRPSRRPSKYYLRDVA